MSIRHVTQFMLRPRRNRAIIMAIERPVIEALWFQEDNRVIVLDGGDQEALGVKRVGWHHGLEAGDMCEQLFRALTLRLTAEDSPTARHAHCDGRSEITV